MSTAESRYQDEINRLRAQLAGVVEQRAKVCDERAEQSEHGTLMHMECRQLAKAIRALADPAAPKEKP